MLYADLEAINNNLTKEIKSFFNNLYTEIFKLKSFKDRFGDIHSHYENFVIKNDNGVCPFCGLTDLKSENLNYIDAYDHFLAKGKYPFSSVNFKNLFPMCHECNSYNKHEKDVIHKKDKKTRKKSFYPYSSFTDDLNIDITLKPKVYSKLKISDIDLEISSDCYPEETQTWSETFGLETRYKDFCTKNNHGRYWLRRIMDECVNYGKTPKEMYDIELKVCSKNMLNEANFLKAPLLKAGEKVGLY